LLTIKDPKAEIERVPPHSFIDEVRLPLDRVTDRRASEVGPVGIKSFINKKIDLAKVRRAPGGDLLFREVPPACVEQITDVGS
jgi:hypothetical protein